MSGAARKAGNGARHRGRPDLLFRHQVLGADGRRRRRARRRRGAARNGLLRHRRVAPGRRADRGPPRRRRYHLAGKRRAVPPRADQPAPGRRQMPRRSPRSLREAAQCRDRGAVRRPRRVAGCQIRGDGPDRPAGSADHRTARARRRDYRMEASPQRRPPGPAARQRRGAVHVVIFGAFERMVAFRYLRARRQEGFVSVIAIFSLLGIALGVATLIIVMSVMNGFRADLLGRILGLNGHLGVYALSGPLADFDAAAQKVADVPGITEVTPLIEGQVMATSEAGAAGALVRGIRPDNLRRRPLLADHIVQGSLAEFDDDGVAVGDRLARRLGVAVGSAISVISPQGTATAFGTMPRIKTYHVAALFNVGMYEYDNSFIYAPLDAAQLFFRLPDAVTNLEVFLADPDRVREERRLIAAALGGQVRIVDWQQANSSLFNAVEIERNVMFLILTLIIVVAAFNIISSMIMMVKDKGRDIAILRTMGASRAMILRIFVLSGASIGVVGTIAGFALGVAFTRNIEAIRQGIQRLIGTDLFAAEIYFFTRIPARIDTGEVAVVVVMALALSFLATLYPSWRAARLDPVEALRYE